MTCAMRLVDKPEGPERRGTDSVEGNSAWRCGNGRGVARLGMSELSVSLEHRVHGREGGEIMRGSRQSREGRQKPGHTGTYMLY